MENGKRLEITIKRDIALVPSKVARLQPAFGLAKRHLTHAKTATGAHWHTFPSLSSRLAYGCPFDLKRSSNQQLFVGRLRRPASAYF
jgi:hypothetical protein